MSDRVNKIIAFEQGDLPDDEALTLFQDMVDDGSIWHLQGSYGRMAAAMIGAGMLHRPAREDEPCADCGREDRPLTRDPNEPAQFLCDSHV